MFVAPYAEPVVAVDLNTIEIAGERNRKTRNVEFVEADIAVMDRGRKFDVVMSIGVVHHTNDPDRTVAKLIRHLKPGRRLILWIYSREGNFWVEHGVEPLRKLFLSRLPLKSLPYDRSFGNFRRLSFRRNVPNVFEKSNAPRAGSYLSSTLIPGCKAWTIRV